MSNVNDGNITEEMLIIANDIESKKIKKIVFDLKGELSLVYGNRIKDIQTNLNNIYSYSKKNQSKKINQESIDFFNKIFGKKGNNSFLNDHEKISRSFIKLEEKYNISKKFSINQQNQIFSLIMSERIQILTERFWTPFCNGSIRTPCASTIPNNCQNSFDACARLAAANETSRNNGTLANAISVGSAVGVAVSVFTVITSPANANRTSTGQNAAVYGGSVGAFAGIAYYAFGSYYNDGIAEAECQVCLATLNTCIGC